MRKFKISIIIPFYNCSWDLLKECLDTITAQLAEDTEVIVIDDGTKDAGVYLLCKEYAKNIPSIRVIRNEENRGVSFTRNCGLELSQGDYVWFIDADDWIEPDALSLLRKTLEEKNVDTVFFEYSRCRGSQKTEEFRNINAEDCAFFSKEMARRMLLSAEFNSPCTILFSKNIIEEYGLRFDEGMKLGEDFKFNYHYLLHFHHGAYIKRSLYNYRICENSATHTFSLHKANDTGEGYFIRKQLLASCFSDEEKPLLQSLFVAGYYRSLRAHALNGILQHRPKAEILECLSMEWSKDLLKYPPQGFQQKLLHRFFMSGNYRGLWLLAQLKKLKRARMR